MGFFLFFFICFMFVSCVSNNQSCEVIPRFAGRYTTYQDAIAAAVTDHSPQRKIGFKDTKTFSETKIPIMYIYKLTKIR